MLGGTKLIDARVKDTRLTLMEYHDLGYYPALLIVQSHPSYLKTYGTLKTKEEAEKRYLEILSTILEGN